MRLKTYTAQTVPEAMAMVRDEMGDEAIIVSTSPAIDGLACRVTAAIEEELMPSPITKQVIEKDDHLFSPDASYDQDLGRDEEDLESRNSYLRQMLMAHGLPPHITEALLRTASAISDPDPVMVLAAGIDAMVSFRPIDLAHQSRPLVLAGIPGAGKTITAAKMAAQAKLARRSVFMATTDAKRAGGVEQLEAFTRILSIDLRALNQPSELGNHEDAIKNADVAIIDTPGVNPFDAEAMYAIQKTAEAIGGEIVLVLPAGGDAMESADTAAAFADIGAERMIITRLDMTRRLGGIVAAAVSGRLAIANVSINPQVADGLTQLNPVALANLILPTEDEPRSAHPHTKAVL